MFLKDEMFQEKFQSFKYKIQMWMGQLLNSQHHHLFIKIENSTTFLGLMQSNL